MTLAVRRTTSTLLAVLAAILLSMTLLAAPATAADEGDHGGETASSGVKGDATGFVYAAVAGVIVGGLAFAMSRPGDIQRADAHHAPKGDQQMAP